jgi:hypothetical protein
MVSISTSPCSLGRRRQARRPAARAAAKAGLLLLAVLLLASLAQAGFPRSALAMPSSSSAVVGANRGTACTGDPDDGEHKPSIQLDLGDLNPRRASDPSAQLRAPAPSPTPSCLLWTWVWAHRALPVAPAPCLWLIDPLLNPAPGGSR